MIYRNEYIFEGDIFLRSEDSISKYINLLSVSESPTTKPTGLLPGGWCGVCEDYTHRRPGSSDLFNFCHRCSQNNCIEIEGSVRMDEYVVAALGIRIPPEIPFHIKTG